MKCILPGCGGKTKVTTTPDTQEGSVYRHRKCLACGHRFRTVELTERAVSALLEAAQQNAKLLDAIHGVRPISGVPTLDEYKTAQAADRRRKQKPKVNYAEVKGRNGAGH